VEDGFREHDVVGKQEDLDNERRELILQRAVNPRWSLAAPGSNWHYE